MELALEKTLRLGGDLVGDIEEARVGEGAVVRPDPVQSLYHVAAVRDDQAVEEIEAPFQRLGEDVAHIGAAVRLHVGVGLGGGVAGAAGDLVGDCPGGADHFGRGKAAEIADDGAAALVAHVAQALLLLQVQLRCAGQCGHIFHPDLSFLKNAGRASLFSLPTCRGRPGSP